jgi:hypothetical protein
MDCNRPLAYGPLAHIGEHRIRLPTPQSQQQVSPSAKPSPSPRPTVPRTLAAPCSPPNALQSIRPSRHAENSKKCMQVHYIASRPSSRGSKYTNPLRPTSSATTAADWGMNNARQKRLRFRNRLACIPDLYPVPLWSLSTKEERQTWLG